MLKTIHNPLSHAPTPVDHILSQIINQWQLIVCGLCSTMCMGAKVCLPHPPHPPHARSWTGSLPHRQAAWTLAGSPRRSLWRGRVHCRRSWPSQAMSAAVTVASQTPAGPVSTWASPSAYSVLAFTGTALHCMILLFFVINHYKVRSQNWSLIPFMTSTSSFPTTVRHWVYWGQRILSLNLLHTLL